MFRRTAIVGLTAVVGLIPSVARADSASRQQSAAAIEATQEEPAKKGPTVKEVLTDAAIIAILIELSRKAYYGPCGCPDDTDGAGHHCGARSAHDRPRGWIVHCSASDITPNMIAAYRASVQQK